MLVAPFVRPANKVGDTPPLPYYLYALIGVSVMAFGLLYWAVWQLVLPYVFKFRLVPRKEVLEDGTVVTLVSHLCNKDIFRLVTGTDWDSVLQRKSRMRALRTMSR